MRIYNKKTFGFGIFALALGLLNIVAGVMTGGQRRRGQG